MECWSVGVLAEKSSRAALGRCALIVLVLASACVALYRDRYSASDLAIVPDSVEYAVGAHHLVSNGHYKIVIGGRDLPPRYPPWFSIFFIAPAYILLGPDPGNAIFPVTAMAMLGVLLAFILGRRIAGSFGGVLSALALVSLRIYRFYGRTVMTDVPCTALLLLLCLLYLRLRDTISSRPDSLPLLYACAGLVTAVCAAIRPPFICAVLPFLLTTRPGRPMRQLLFRGALLLLPPLAVIGGTMACNFAVFGSWLRSGYHFWCPVPYDFPALTMSLRHIVPNATRLAMSGLAACILLSPAIVLLARARLRHSSLEACAAARQALVFAALSCGPAVVFHMLYFYPDPRFFLPVAAVLLVPAMAIIALCLPVRPDGPVAAVIQVLVLATFIAARLMGPTHRPTSRMAADRIREHTPDDALVISALDPAYLEFMVCRDSRRAVIPVSRRIEYACKVMAPRKLAIRKSPLHWMDYSRPSLIAAGALDPVPDVAIDGAGTWVKALQAGKPVYIDTSHMSERETAWVRWLGKGLRLTPKAEHLYELGLK